VPVDKKYFLRDIEEVFPNASPCNLIYTVVVIIKFNGVDYVIITKL